MQRLPEPAGTTAERARSTPAGHRWVAQACLTLYAIALTAIALWPVPVDSGARGTLDLISSAVPWLSYDVIEVSANVVLFVPLGVLLAILIPRARWLVAPIALAVSGLIEWLQAQFLDERTSSVRDVVANVAGAVIGLTIILVVEYRGRMKKVS